MGVTLTDPNILVNLPHFLGEGRSIAFSGKTGTSMFLNYVKVKLRLGVKNYKVEGVTILFNFLRGRPVSFRPSG